MSQEQLDIFNSERHGVSHKVIADLTIDPDFYQCDQVNILELFAMEMQLIGLMESEARGYTQIFYMDQLNRDWLLYGPDSAGMYTLQRNSQIALCACRHDSKRYAQHRLTLYIAYDRDWTSRPILRNGDIIPPLERLRMRGQAWEYIKPYKRAMSLRYSGLAPQDEAGFVEDLQRLGYDDYEVSQFAEAAKPFWPEVTHA